MTTNSLLNIAFIGILSLLPLSLIIINAFTKLMSKVDVQLKNISTILTSVRGVLTSSTQTVQHIIFDHFELQTQEESNLLHIFNEETKNELRMEKKHLEKIEGIKTLAIITSLCHYEKLAKIEQVISNFFKSCNISPFQIKTDYEIITEIPSNANKKISTVVAIKKDTQEIFSFTKGNPNQILERCTRIFLDDKKIELNQQMRRKLRKKIERINKHGEKIIAFAYKGLPLKRLENYNEQFTENDLIFAGMITLAENPNLNLIPEIEEAQKNGIKFYVISHTKEREAVAIATELKLINPHYFETVTGNDLIHLNEQKLIKIFTNKEKDYIFCELKNNDKEKIIEALKKSGETIALAQKNTMNITEILQQIKTSKARSLNSEKLVFHELSLKIGLTLSFLISLIFKIPPALGITSILLIEAINIPLQLGLRAEPGEENNLKPNDQKNYIHLVFNGFIYGIIISTIYVFSLMRFGWIPFTEGVVLSDIAQTSSLSLSLTAVLLLQLLNAQNIRNPKKSIFSTRFLSNPYLTMVSILSLFLTYLIFHLPQISNQLKIKPLSATEWQIVIFLCLTIVITEELRKFLIKKSTSNAT